MKSLVTTTLLLATSLFLLASACGKGKELEESMARGSSLYEELCMNCHLPSGEGVPGSFPPLAGSDYLLENRTASIRAVKYGQEGEITVNGATYNGRMAAPGLTDEEVADVMNYILNAWGNASEEMVTVQEVTLVVE